MRVLRKNFDLIAFLLLVTGFVYVASQRLGSAPLPDDGDESMTLQVPYEIINRGHLGWPMYRYQGGNIENNWHSLRPFYYLMLTGFSKLFGWGLLQGRAFNLIIAVFLLAVVYLTGRKLFDWRAALVAVLMLVSDPTFLERSRMVRHDYSAAMFALLAYLLFEWAREQRRGSLYVASGLAAGAGVMCHTNGIHILGGIVLLMLLTDGVRAFSTRRLYQFLGGAFAVMAYEIIYDLVDYKNVLLQYQADKAHFSIFSPAGWWENLAGESTRYKAWYSGELIFPNTPLTLLHLVQLLCLVAIIYLLVVCAIQVKHKNAMSDPRVRVLTITVSAMLFLALSTGYKRKYLLYMIHLTPWFALVAGIFVRDSTEFAKRLTLDGVRPKELLNKVAMGFLALAIVAYGALLVRQNKRYLRQVNNPESASFEEFAAALRSVVPEGLCPASFLRPVVWLVFPESDQCYSTIEGRMMDAVDIAGRDYALIVPTKQSAPWMRNPEGAYHLIGALDNTPYGDMRVYYTGVDPRYLSLKPTYWRFFFPRSGHIIEEQPSGAREIGSPDAAKRDQVVKSGGASSSPGELN